MGLETVPVRHRLIFFLFFSPAVINVSEDTHSQLRILLMSRSKPSLTMLCYVDPEEGNTHIDMQ